MDRIRQHIENIEIPEQLRPEVVEEQLMRHQKMIQKESISLCIDGSSMSWAAWDSVYSDKGAYSWQKRVC